jgi:integrase
MAASQSEVTPSVRKATPGRLALSLGLRRGELLGLRWQDLGLDAATLRVARSLQRIGARSS